MTIPNQERNLTAATIGWQLPITGTNVSKATTLTVADLQGDLAGIKLAGAGALATGTYSYFIPTAGCSAVDVSLLMASHTGTAPTCTLVPLLSDNVTAKTTPTSVTVTDATLVTTSITTLRGERGCLLKIVVPGASSATFTVADMAAL